MTDDRETIAADVHWSCGLCAANGRQMEGVDRDSMEMHMNDHIAGALEDPVRMVIDIRLPGELPPPEPKMLDVTFLETPVGPGWGLVEYGTEVPVLLVTPYRDLAEYVARLWNVDHS